MFLNGKARLAMKRAERADERPREESRQDLPVLVRNRRGRFVRHYGEMSRSGCIYRSDRAPSVGELVDLRLALLGMGMVVAARGRVTRVVPQDTHQVVEVRFEGLPFETEQVIRSWLQLFSSARHATTAA